MKSCKTPLLTALLACLAVLPASASAANASATASVTLVAPISLATHANMSFGTFILGDGAFGTCMVELTVAGNLGTPSDPSIIAHTDTSGTNAAFYFNSPGNVINVLSDATITLTHLTDASQTLLISDITYQADGCRMNSNENFGYQFTPGTSTWTLTANNGVAGASSGTLKVGGRIAVPAHCAPGIYLGTYNISMSVN